ncbi:MAG: hypothetical protein ACLR9I_05605 [Eisenbergiella sp.]
MRYCEGKEKSARVIFEKGFLRQAQKRLEENGRKHWKRQGKISVTSFLEQLADR